MRHAEINDSVGIVIQRLDDDFVRALPNSVSIRNAGTRSIVEMLEVSSVVFYRGSGELDVPPVEDARELQFPVAQNVDQNFSVYGFLDATQPGPNYNMNFARLVVGTSAILLRTPGHSAATETTEFARTFRRQKRMHFSMRQVWRTRFSPTT